MCGIKRDGERARDRERDRESETRRKIFIIAAILLTNGMERERRGFEN